MHLRIALWVWILAACNASSSTRREPVAPPESTRPFEPVELPKLTTQPQLPPTQLDSPVELGDLYAVFFEEGRQFRYRVDAQNTWIDESDPKADAEGFVRHISSYTMRCRVDEVQRFEAAVASHVACERSAEGGNEGVEGVYLATRDGLWQRDTFPTDEDLKALEPTTMLIPRVPIAYDRTEESPEGFGVRVRFHERNVAWCYEGQVMGGNSRGMALCF